MKNQMKRFVAMLLASLAILALVGCSSSDGDKTADYPKENITVIVPYSAGGPTDMSVRALLDAASKYLPSGVSFMPENQTGAGGLIGMSATAASDNDGYTLGPIAVDLLMMKYEGKTQLGLDSFVPLAATMADPYGLLVAANNGKYDSVEEFVAYCKAHPGEVTVGNSGVGTATHLAAIAFERDFGITLNHVSYDGFRDHEHRYQLPRLGCCLRSCRHRSGQDRLSERYLCQGCCQR